MYEVVHESLTVDDMIHGRECFPWAVPGTYTQNLREALVFAGVLALEHAERLGLPVVESGDGYGQHTGYNVRKPGEWDAWYTVRKVTSNTLGETLR